MSTIPPGLPPSNSSFEGSQQDSSWSQTWNTAIETVMGQLNNMGNISALTMDGELTVICAVLKVTDPSLAAQINPGIEQLAQEQNWSGLEYLLQQTLAKTSTTPPEPTADEFSQIADIIKQEGASIPEAERQDFADGVESMAKLLGYSKE